MYPPPSSKKRANKEVPYFISSFLLFPDVDCLLTYTNIFHKPLAFLCSAVVLSDFLWAWTIFEPVCVSVCASVFVRKAQNDTGINKERGSPLRIAVKLVISVFAGFEGPRTDVGLLCVAVKFQIQKISSHKTHFWLRPAFKYHHILSRWWYLYTDLTQRWGSHPLILG